jgi:hypothetical protein
VVKGAWVSFTVYSSLLYLGNIAVSNYSLKLKCTVRKTYFTFLTNTLLEKLPDLLGEVVERPAEVNDLEEVQAPNFETRRPEEEKNGILYFFLTDHIRLIVVTSHQQFPEKE